MPTFTNGSGPGSSGGGSAVATASGPARKKAVGELELAPTLVALTARAAVTRPAERVTVMCASSRTASGAEEAGRREGGAPQGLVGDLLGRQRLGHLGRRRPDAFRHRCQRLEVEAVEPGRVAADHRPHLVLGHA